MTDKKTYYFSFDRNCINPRTEVKMQPYWVELHGADTKAEARDTMIKLYACGFTTHTEKDLEWLKEICKGGCYEAIHLPLPSDVFIECSDPFFSQPKKKKSAGEQRRIKNYALGGMSSGHSHVGKPIKPVSASKFNQVLRNKGVALKEVHNATGVSLPTLMDLRNGKKKLYHKRTIENLADYLGVDPKDIF